MADAAISRPGIKHKDYSGQKFGRLTATARCEPYGKGQPFWMFQCDCGTTSRHMLYHVLAGRSSSCGCASAERAAALGRKKRRHGMEGTPLYAVYRSMKGRCCNSHHKQYQDYGGRGITVCAEWLESPAAFFLWASQNGYGLGLEIDRRENDSGYSPQNCRFVTRTVNCNNRRSSTLLEYDGRVLGIAEWAREMKLHPSSISKRFHEGKAVKGRVFRRAEKRDNL